MSTPAPVFIFAAPYCGASRLAAMLGRHPQLCALPELSLFVGDDIGDLLEIAEFGHGLTLDGLLRAIAELGFGAQTDATVEQARGWLEQRQDHNIGDLLSQLRRWAEPRRLVVADAQAPLRPIDLQRCATAAPNARVLHLTRHPHTQGVLFADSLKQRQFVPTDYKDHMPKPGEIDPQIPWLRANENILRAIADGGDDRYLRIDAAALDTNSDWALAQICGWLGVAAEPSTLALMHEHRAWRFWNVGPAAAPLGLEAEAYEMDQPHYRRRAARASPLDAGMPWKRGAPGFAPEVRALAAHFGYR